MINGWNIEVFQDKRNRKLMHIKQTETYYQVHEKDEKYVTLLKNNIINAVSIAAMITYFLNLHPVWWFAIMGLVYGAYLLLFNKRILPRFSIVKNKHIEKKQESVSSSKYVLFLGVGFILIGIGLILCIVFEQVTSTIERYMVIGFSIFSFGMGMMQLRAYRMTKSRR